MYELDPHYHNLLLLFPQGYSLELSLIIVALVDVGLMLTLLGVVLVRAWLSNRAAEREAANTAQVCHSVVCHSVS